VEAMFPDPMYYAVFPDREQSYRYFTPFWKAIIEYSMEFGVVLTTGDCMGAMCLLSPENTEFTFDRLWKTGCKVPLSVMQFPFSQMRQTMDILMSLGAMQSHLLPEPHWYLLAIGVMPEEQGKGIGSCLMNEAIDIASKDNRSIYLETETEKNVLMYRKYGFEVVRETVLDGHGLEFTFMVRDKR